MPQHIVDLFFCDALISASEQKDTVISFPVILNHGVSAGNITSYPDKLCMDMRVMKNIQKELPFLPDISGMPDIQARSSKRNGLVQSLSACVNLPVLRQQCLSPNQNMIYPVNIINIQ